MTVLSTPSDHAIIRSPKPKDRNDIINISKGIDIFSSEEIKIITELIDCYFNGDKRCLFKIAKDKNNSVLGFICYGKADLSDGIWELYWKVVKISHQRQGIGTILLKTIENEIEIKAGRAILIETASKPEYEPARRFYEKLCYKEICRIKDFYSLGDDKIIYRKFL